MSVRKSSSQMPRGRGRSGKSHRRGEWGFPEYVPVHERRERAEELAEKLVRERETSRARGGKKSAAGRVAKTTQSALQRIPAGSALGATFWSKAWNRNLESYADFESRLGRGRSYVRNGSVLDLIIDTGLVQSRVAGSRPQPYVVRVQIAPASASAIAHLRKTLRGTVENIGQLFAGRFPTGLSDLLVAKGTGLFPTPDQIHFNCNCPDWAGLCKHVAATLYGIGIRFDGDPGLFFKLRGIDIETELAGLVRKEVNRLLSPKSANSKAASRKVPIGSAKRRDAKATHPESAKNKAKIAAKSMAIQRLQLTDAALKELFGI
jgi:uncharacterized Zn finger protein